MKEVLFFQKGKNKGNHERYVAFTDLGKVIIGENIREAGYYEILEKKELSKCIIATGRRVIKDIYSDIGDIGVEELLKVLPLHGYRLSYKVTFCGIHSEGFSTPEELRVVAYNPELNVILVADTITLEGKKVFNNIKCYCYGINASLCLKDKYFSFGSGKYVVYDLAMRGCIDGLQFIKRVANTGNVSFKMSDLPSNIIPENGAKGFISKCDEGLKGYIRDHLER